ncbi:MAG: hypothetical protein FWD04_05730 [Conexibacteraceae bacterium]|nr:hypothetical protein [Conexibacteraceae bacterium]
MLFAVTLTRGGPWDWSRGLREQEGFEEHARIMDAFVADRFILLGGPLEGEGEGERAVLHVIEADSEEAVRERLAQDNWHANGMLTVTSIRRWTVLLDGLRAIL